MDSLKTVSKQTIWQLFGKAITSLSTIIILGAVSRHFSKESVGVFTQALTYLAFFYTAVDFGLNAYILSHLLDENAKDRWRKLLGLRILWALILIVIALIILPILPFHSSDFNKAVLFGSLAILGYSLFISATAVFQSKLRYDLSVIASSIDAVPTVFLVLFFISLNLSVSSLLLVHMIGWILTGLVSLFFIKRFFSRLSPIFDLGFIKKTVMDAWPISLTLVLNVVYFRVDSFILASVKSFAEVGLYNVAYQIFQSALVLPTFIMNSYFPLQIQLLKDSKERFRSQLRKVLGIMLLISILGTILTLLLSPMVIQIISGNGFDGSVSALRLLSLSFPAYFLSSVLMLTLISLKRYKVMFLIYLVGLLVNSALNFIFIPQYSFYASSIITGISEYLILILQLLILWKEL